MTDDGWPHRWHVVPAWAAPACLAALFMLGGLGAWLTDQVVHRRRAAR